MRVSVHGRSDERRGDDGVDAQVRTREKKRACHDQDGGREGGSAGRMHRISKRGVLSREVQCSAVQCSP
jgi:hypothetical protein